jgi:AcrR family transcriptional regulator
MAKHCRTAASATLTWARPAEPPPVGRVPLTREDIVSTAIRLIDESGLEAFSMRRLGTELGAGATSLYWHVRNKDELVDLILDVIIGEVHADYEAAVAPDATWRERLAEVARALRRVLLRHRHIAPLLGDRPTIGPNALDAAEHVMAILRGAGFDARSASLASGALINFASGFALFEARTPGAVGDGLLPVAATRSLPEHARSVDRAHLRGRSVRVRSRPAPRRDRTPPPHDPTRCRGTVNGGRDGERPASTLMVRPVAGEVVGRSRAERFHEAEARIGRVTHILDDLVPIPGTNQKVGVDPVVGLIPVVGDVVGALAGAWVIAEAARFGIPRVALARMVVNLLVDLGLGMIPVVGIVFDVVSRSNAANLELFRRHALDPDATTAGHWSFFGGLLILMVGAIWLVFELVSRAITLLAGAIGA